jgi:hypothetical protein
MSEKAKEELKLQRERRVQHFQKSLSELAELEASCVSLLPLRIRDDYPLFHPGSASKNQVFLPVLGIRIRRIRMVLDLQDPDPLVRDTDPAPDPSLFL